MRRLRSLNLKRPQRRRGATVVELVVSGIVLGAAMTVAVQLSAAAARQHRYADDRQFAENELANLMEQITARYYATVDQTAFDDWEPSDAARDRLRGAKLNVEVTSTNGDGPAGKRIALSLQWRDAGDQETAPARLVTWIYPPANPGGAP